MKRSLKLLVGILISACLFYLFIKDVNEIAITADSGFNHSVASGINNALYVGYAEGFKPGDAIILCDDSVPDGVPLIVKEIVLAEDKLLPDCIVVEPGLDHEFTMDGGAFIRFPRLQRALSSANYWWLVPALFLTIFALIIRAYRWKFFFPEHKNIKFNSLWIAVCIGYMANNVLPFRMGEIIRAWVFGKKENRSVSESFGTIVMERILDILSILVVFVGCVFYFVMTSDVKFPDWLMTGSYILSAISILAFVILLFLRIKTEQSLKVIRKILSFFPEKFSNPILQLVSSFIEGLSILNSFGSFFCAFGLSMLIWLDLAFAYFYVFKAVNIEATVLISLFLIVGLAFAVSIPSAPGFIGTFHLVGEAILVMMGIEGNIEAYVLLAHALAYIPVVLLGFLYLSMENLSFRDLKTALSGLGKSE